MIVTKGESGVKKSQFRPQTRPQKNGLSMRFLSVFSSAGGEKWMFLNFYATF